MADNIKGTAQHVIDTLKKASEELLDYQGGYCSSVDDENINETFSHDQAEVAGLMDIDMKGEEGDNLEPFKHLISNTNHVDLTGDGMVLKILVNPGIGQVVPENNLVLVHYTDYISNPYKPFDVTHLQNKIPQLFTLGNGELVPGLEIGIKTMTVRENARFIIKPEMAYGIMGCPPRIPPNATVQFDVHLVAYSSPPQNSITCDRVNPGPNQFEKNLEKVEKLYIKGNKQLKLKNIDLAVFKYNQALELLQIAKCNDVNDEIEMMKYLNMLYSNLSFCYSKQCAFDQLCRLGTDSMRYSERFSRFNPKLFFDWGKASRLLKEFTEARKYLSKALNVQPKNKAILFESQKLKRDMDFHNKIKLVLPNDDNERLAPEFWKLFNTRLAEFCTDNDDTDDDVLTFMINKNPDDIEAIKNKASAYDLQVHLIAVANGKTNFIVFKK